MILGAVNVAIGVIIFNTFYGGRQSKSFSVQDQHLVLSCCSVIVSHTCVCTLYGRRQSNSFLMNDFELQKHVNLRLHL